LDAETCLQACVRQFQELFEFQDVIASFVMSKSLFLLIANKRSALMIEGFTFNANAGAE